MTAGSNVQKMKGGLVFLRKPVQRVAPEDGVVREATTGRVVTLLPRVWAVAAAEVVTPRVPETAGTARPKVELAFYRKYTEALLRRYLRLSMEVGRVPSLLGREMFRGHVTSYRVRGFEDTVIFCHDVESCLTKLDRYDQELIRRIALQQYTQAETAALLGVCLRTIVTRYGKALDALTGMFAERQMLEPLKSCQ